jgi:hypothetical protein
MNTDKFQQVRDAWADVPAPSAETRQAVRRRLETTMGSVTQRRARRRYRPQTLLAAALLLGLLGAVPAFSGTGYDRVVKWLTGEPPKEVVENLERMDQGAPPGMAQHPIVGKTGLVYKRQTQYGEVRVWLTPAKGGDRFCQSFEAPRPDGKTRPFSGGCFPAALQRPIEVGGSGGGTDIGAGYLNGRVAPWITKLELRYVNGGSDQIPLQNGYFVAAVDLVRTLRLTDHPTQLVGYDEAGKPVASASVANFYGHVGIGGFTPPIAEVDQERPAIMVELPSRGRAVLHESPSRAGGNCDRLAVDGTTWTWTCADPAELPQPIRFTALRPPVKDGVAVLLTGVVKPGLTLSFRFEDGQSDEVPLTNQRFLVSIPEERWQSGRRLSGIVVSEGHGPMLEIPMGFKSDAFYSGEPDRPPSAPMHQIFNPTQHPIVARLPVKGSNGEQLELFVRRETPTHWYEVLSINDKVVSGSNLQWFKGGGDAIISASWQPMNPGEFAVDRPISLFLGHIRHPAHQARVTYADGSSEQLELARPSKPTGGGIAGWFIYEMTPQQREKKPRRFEALNGAGDVMGHSALPRGA